MKKFFLAFCLFFNLHQCAESSYVFIENQSSFPLFIRHSVNSLAQDIFFHLGDIKDRWIKLPPSVKTFLEVPDDKEISFFLYRWNPIAGIQNALYVTGGMSTVVAAGSFLLAPAAATAVGTAATTTAVSAGGVMASGKAACGFLWSAYTKLTSVRRFVSTLQTGIPFASCVLKLSPQEIKKMTISPFEANLDTIQVESSDMTLDESYAVLSDIMGCLGSSPLPLQEKMNTFLQNTDINFDLISEGYALCKALESWVETREEETLIDHQQEDMLNEISALTKIAEKED